MRTTSFLCLIFPALFFIDSSLFAEELSTPLQQQKLESCLERAERFLERGDGALEQYQYPEALEFYTQAIRLYHESGNFAHEKAVLSYLPGIYLEIHQYEQALQSARRLLERAEETGDMFYEGIAGISLGDIHREQTQLRQALDDYRQALNSFNRLQEYEDDDSLMQQQIVALGSIGNTYSELGRYHDAMRFYRQASQLITHAENLERSPESLQLILRLKGEVLRDLGTTSLRVGSYEKALHSSQQALTVFQKPEINDEKNQSDVLTTIGSIYESLGDEHRGYFLLALNMYDQAFDLLSEHHSRDMGLILSNKGKAFARLGSDTERKQDHEAALRLYQEALKHLEQARAISLKARTLNNIAESRLFLSQYEQKDEHLQKAHSALNDALTIQNTIQDRLRLWITHSNLGQVLEAQGLTGQAIQSSQDSIAVFEDLIASSAIEELTFSLREQINATYQRLILLLMGSGQFKEAFLFSERARARAFLDMLGQRRSALQSSLDPELLKKQQDLQLELAELQHQLQKEHSRLQNGLTEERLIEKLSRKFQKKRGQYQSVLEKIGKEKPEYGMLSSVDALPLHEVQQRLDRETTLLSYFVTPRKTMAFIIIKDDFIAVPLSFEEEELRHHIRNVRQPVTKEHSFESLEWLYEKLITPLSRHLQTEKVGILPHGILHYLPFAALKNGRTYLGDQYTLFSLPSASVLKYLPEETPTLQNSEVLALANGLETEEAPPLQFVDEEINAIASRFDTRRLLDEEATTTALNTLAGQFPILHLATHGKLDIKHPLDSHLLLADGKLPVSDVYNLKLAQSELVVLSACDTLLGKQSRGDDIIGLTRAFMYAGAPSVIASLWKVEDLATAEFMAVFYKYLAKGTGKAQALRVAQQKIRKKFPNPLDWAGFVLTGDPGESIKNISRIEISIAALAVISIFLLLRAMNTKSPVLRDSP